MAEKIIFRAAKHKSYEILTFMFLDRRVVDTSVETIYSSSNEETIEWLFKMNINTYPEYIEYLIISSKILTETGKHFIFKQLKKYLTRISKQHPEGYDFPQVFMYYLGDSLTVLDLESRKEIFNLMISIDKKIDLEYCIALAIRGSENVESKKRNEWIKFLNSYKNAL